MRIVFMGGKTLGDRILNFLKREETVVYQLYQYDNLCVGTFLESPSDAIKRNKPDLIIVVCYDYILPKEIINIPKYGCINLHIADTEKYRGCYPTTRAVLDEAKEHGVTIHRIDENIDTGPILHRITFPISGSMTGKELYDYVNERAWYAFLDFWHEFKKNPEMKGKKQDLTKGTYQKRGFPDQQILVSSEEQRRILAFTFEGYPPPYINIKGRRFKIVEDEDTPT